MKKIISVLLCIAMLAAFAGCSSTKNLSETYNGITRAESTVKENGKETTSIVYTDEDGNVLDPEIGEKAFELAKNGDKDALATVMAESEAADPTEAAAAEAPAEEAEETVVQDAADVAEQAAEAEAAAEANNTEAVEAVVHIYNETNSTMSEVYFVFSNNLTMGIDDMDEEDWEEDMLSSIGALAPGDGFNFGVTYTSEGMFRLLFATEDGVSVQFDDVAIGSPADPENIYITITENDDGYTITVE